MRLVEIVRGLRDLDLRKSPSDLRDHRLGPDARRARGRGAHRRRAVAHAQRGGEVRARPRQGDAGDPGAGRPERHRPRRRRPRARPRARARPRGHPRPRARREHPARRRRGRRTGRSRGPRRQGPSRSPRRGVLRRQGRLGRPARARASPRVRGRGRSRPAPPASGRSEPWRTRSTGSSGCCGCYGVRVSTAEAVDAMHAVAQPGVLGRPRGAARRRWRSAWSRTGATWRPSTGSSTASSGSGRSSRTTAATGTATPTTTSPTRASSSSSRSPRSPGDTPEEGHSHGKPDDIKQYFKHEDLAQQYNLHQEANKIDIAALTDEIVLSNDTEASAGEAARVQLSTSRMHNPGAPGDLVTQARDAARHRATVAEEMALLSWLEDSAGGEDDDLALPSDSRLPRGAARGAGAVPGEPARAR